MAKESISYGKRPKNPMIKRVWKDIWRDKKRYFLIFIMFVLTIGFVSGMFVSNNSMNTSLEECAERFKREDGHFRLSKPADKETVAAIESGKIADVASVFRERAYNEAEDEVIKAVDDAMAEEIDKQVRSAITEQVTAALDKQFETAAETGHKLTDEQKKAALEEALDKALSENFDKAYDEALKQAKDSDEYDDALKEAFDKAHEEIDKEIDDKVGELSDRYGLDKEIDTVPVTVYEMFYKDVKEGLADDADPSIGIRVYPERKDVNLYDILEGKAPENKNEIMIDRMHADNVGIKVGDTITVDKEEFEVCGLAAFVDYSTLYENNTDTMFDAMTFNVAMTTEEGFERIHSNTRANYAFTYNDRPDDEYEEKSLSDDFMKALITQVAVSEDEDIKLEDYVPAYANQAINFAKNDLGTDMAMGGVMLYILTAVLAFIFAVTISTTLEKESSVIGTLRASGYTKGELLRYYMSAPLMIAVFSALVGNILGYTFFKNVVVGMYYNSYSLPTYKTLWTPYAFIRTTIIPIVLMLIINLVVILRTLRLSPLRFLRHDLKRSKRKKAVRLPRWRFFPRFRIRVFLQNIPNYLMLFVGITFVMLLLSMAVGMRETLDYHQAHMCESMFAKEQLVLSRTEDDDGSTITTSAKNAERISISSLERKSDTYNEEISVYGVKDDSLYIRLDADFNEKAAEDEVYISRAYADKYKINVGDTIVLSEKYEHKDYTWKVYDIYDYSAGLAVFMTNERFNEVFDKDKDDFSGYICNEPITDIDDEYVAAEITEDDLLKVARQLDHSMGAYMEYFQYVCVIVAALILYLLTKIIIEKNERAISMTKVLGYNDNEIASLYLIPTAIFVFITEFIAIYLGFTLMTVFWKAMMLGMSGWFEFTMPVSGFVKEFLLVFIAYLLITFIDFFRIRKIPKVLALKNIE